jgi:hypothetical protein
MGFGWTAYDAGRAVGRLALPPDVEPLDFGNQWILARRLDSLDIATVALYDIRDALPTQVAQSVARPVEPLGRSYQCWIR